MSAPLVACAAAYARARAMQGRMPGQSEFQRLLATTTSAEFMQRLAGMGMISSPGLSPARAQKELQQGVIRATEKLMRFLRKPLRDFFAFFIYTYDLLNLETVIIHIHSGSDEQISDLLYDSGAFGLLNIEACKTATNFAALGKSLRSTPLADSYNTGLDHFREDDDLAAFLCFLEQEFMRRWQAAANDCAGLLPAAGMKLFSRFTLVTTITSSLRERFCRKADPALSRRWLEVGTRTGLKACMHALEHDDPGDAAQALMRILFADDEWKALVSEPFDLTEMETRLQRLLLGQARKSQRQAGVNPGFLVAFLLRMQVQVRDIIRIMEGKNLGMRTEAIMQHAIGA